MTRSRILRAAAVAGLLLALVACAPAVQSYDPYIDSDLSCEELALEVSKMRTVKAEAQSNKGMSGQNIAWALFFPLGILANESNNSEAIRAADERLFYLYQFYDEKSCPSELIRSN